MEGRRQKRGSQGHDSCQNSPQSPRLSLIHPYSVDLWPKAPFIYSHSLACSHTHFLSHSFTCSFSLTHSFAHSLSLIHLLILSHSFTCSFSLTHSLSHMFMYLFSHTLPFSHSFSHSLIHLLVLSLVHSLILTHSFPHSHSLTHSLIGTLVHFTYCFPFRSGGIRGTMLARWTAGQHFKRSNLCQGNDS